MRGFRRPVGTGVCVALLTIASVPVAQSADLTARQLTASLGVSAAAISSAVNQLIDTGLVVRDPIPGSRQEHYRLAAGGILGAVMRKQEATPHLADLAETGVEVVGENSPGAERLSELAEFVRFMDDELKGIAERWKQHQAQRHA